MRILVASRDKAAVYIQTNKDNPQRMLFAGVGF